MYFLIAEDDPVVQMFHRSIVEKLGHKCDTVSNGEEAVKYVRKNKGKYDFCLMDVDMPKMNGVEAARVIRKIGDYFPILALTASERHKKECFDAGVDDFLLKPCVPEVFIDKVKCLSVKLFNLLFQSNNFELTEVKPMDKKHAEELRVLAEQGLCKMNIRGLGEDGLTVVVHKNIPYKISMDFVGSDNDVSVFLDRSPDKPAECYLYKSSFPMPTVYLQESVFAEKIREENEQLKDCTEMVVKKNEK